MPQPMARLQQQEARSELGLPACLQEPAGSGCLKQTKTKAVQARGCFACVKSALTAEAETREWVLVVWPGCSPGDAGGHVLAALCHTWPEGARPGRREEALCTSPVVSVGGLKQKAAGQHGAHLPVLCGAARSCRTEKGSLQAKNEGIWKQRAPLAAETPLCVFIGVCNVYIQHI